MTATEALVLTVAREIGSGAGEKLNLHESAKENVASS